MHAIRLQKIERRAKEQIWNLQLWNENPRPRKNRAPGQNSDPLNSSLLGAVWNKNKSRPIPKEKRQSPNREPKQVVRNPSAYYRGEEKLAVVVNKNHQCDEHHCNCWKGRNTNGVVKGSFVFYLANDRFVHKLILQRCLSKRRGGLYIASVLNRLPADLTVPVSKSGPILRLFLFLSDAKGYRCLRRCRRSLFG